MNLQDAIREFYFFQRDNGKACAKLYRSQLESLPYQDEDVSEISFQQLRTYLFSAKHLKPASLNIRIGSVRSLFSYLHDSHQIAANPTHLIKRLHVPVQDARYLKHEEVRRLRATLAANGSRRDRALLETLLSTGIRISEALSLTCAAAGYSSLTIIGKGGHARKVFVPPELLKLIAGIAKGRPAESPLFLSSQGRRLSKTRVASLLKIYCKMAKVPIINIHGLRHSFAQALMERSGNNLYLVSNALGHRDVKTTTRYLRVEKSQQAKFITNLYA